MSTFPAATEVNLAAGARAAFTPQWLAAQRWFRSKRRSIASVELFDAADIGDRAALIVLAVHYADGADDRYLVVGRQSGRLLREAGDGEGAWRRLVALMAAGADFPGRQGHFRFDATPALAELLPTPLVAAESLEERQLTGEQTNTSVVLGERLILKLFRLLEPGPNPDLEVTAFLTEVGFAGAPPLAGSMSYELDGASAAAAMLQAYVPGATDAWSVLLSRLRAGLAGETLEDIRRIGQVTRELHAALGSRPEHPDFPARAALPPELAAWQASAGRELDAAVAAVSDEERATLERLAPRARERFGAIGRAAGAPVSRIHGDLHLGQLLRGGEGYVVIDFEGEPIRSVAERRAPASPLRDVAGLLRSLDYAARAARVSDASFEALTWLPQAREALLTGYGAISPAEQPLLDAFELEKACYEVRYEANNRPTLLWLPLAAIRELLHDDARE